MSRDSQHQKGRSDQQREREPYAPLPAWDTLADPQAGKPSTAKTPPRAEAPQRHVAPQTGTIFKAVGVVLVISALVVAAILAIPGGDGDATPTATTGAAVVMAPSDSALLPVASPVDDLAFDARNASVTICLDAGHGGKDMGYQRSATSSVPAMDESYFNLAIAKELERRLTERGFVVIMTRTDDREVNVDDFDANNDGQTEAGGSDPAYANTIGELDEMQSRIDRCNDAKANIIVSIHVDGSDDPVVRGSRVWYSASRPFAQQNQSLAALIYEELEDQMRAVGYPWIGQGMAESGDALDADAHAQLQQLLIGPDREELKEPSAMPGAVVEVLTITSDADATFLASEQGLPTIATALDRAIVRYVDAALRNDG